MQRLWHADWPRQRRSKSSITTDPRMISCTLHNERTNCCFSAVLPCIWSVSEGSFFKSRSSLSSSALPHKFVNWINYTGRILCLGRHKECHCAGGTMRHGWIHIEPLWYVLSSVADGRRRGRVQRRSHCTASQTALGPKSFTLMFEIPLVPSKMTESGSVCVTESVWFTPSSLISLYHLHTIIKYFFPYRQSFLNIVVKLPKYQLALIVNLFVFISLAASWMDHKYLLGIFFSGWSTWFSWMGKFWHKCHVSAVKYLSNRDCLLEGILQEKECCYAEYHVLLWCGRVPKKMIFLYNSMTSRVISLLYNSSTKSTHPWLTTNIKKKDLFAYLIISLSLLKEIVAQMDQTDRLVSF